MSDDKNENAAGLGPAAIESLQINDAPFEPIYQSKIVEINQVADRLTTLSETEYQFIRKDEAKKLGIRVSALDNIVKDKRSKSPAMNDDQIIITDVEPWHLPVDGSQLAEEFAEIISTHNILINGAADAIALWCLFTYAHDCFRTSPRLLAHSPVKRCGKTTLMSTVSALANRSLMTSNVTTAAIFRLIDEVHPTLLIDEADTFIHNSAEMAGIINSGHSKDGASVVRLVSDDHKPKRFNTWSPMMIAQIGLPPETIVDRSIAIPMRRKSLSVQLPKLDLVTSADFQRLKSQAMRWASDNADALYTHGRTLPDFMNDRELDNWQPIFAIAMILGDDWPDRILEASRLLSEASPRQNEAYSEMMIQDIKDIFDHSFVPKIGSLDLVNKLVALEHRPWSEWKNGRPITQRQLAELLAPFGIYPKSVRINNDQYRGYDLNDFLSSFESYLP